MGKGESPVWHGLTKAQLTEEYGTFRMTPEEEGAYIDGYINASARWCEVNGEPDIVKYGKSDAETVRVHRSHVPGLRPVFFNFQGGYWRIPGDFVGFVGAGLNPKGVQVVNVGYGTMPSYTMENLVEQAATGIQWTLEHAEQFDIDVNNAHLGGHSAGGHLAAVMAGLNFLPPDTLKTITCVSGLYDLGFALHGHLSEGPRAIHLTPDHAQRYSPVNMVPQTHNRIRVLVGQKETPEFHRQASDLYAQWSKKGVNIQKITTKNDNHYTLYGGLGNPQSLISRLVLGQVARSRS